MITKDDGSVMAAVILNQNRILLRDIDKYRTIEKKVDQTVYFCEPCEKVWEYKLNGSGYYYNNTVYYKHIPSYGKKRRVCMNCKERNKNDITK
jgi:hypothetical protein|tara:strand:- start:471 stop:749 length:279 start_codon:yes stop_codon:yes gene_type:complete